MVTSSGAPGALVGRWLGLAVLAGIGAVVFAIRMTGPPNLLDNEFRLGACVLDVLQHGNWLCPHDVLGRTDKPPMLTWLAALASWPSGRVTRWSLYLPTAVATVLLGWLVAVAGGRRFGRRAGFLGGLAYMLSYAAASQMATARWDGLFALTIAFAALAAFRAWACDRSWTPFWLAAAVGTLTKGPLGVVLAALGLLAVPWEGATGHRRPLAGSHVAGIALYLLVTLGWFLLALLHVGPRLASNMFLDELLGHMVQHRPGSRFLKPLGDFLWNFGPWSVLAIFGMGRAILAPSSDDEVRRFERFLVCWTAGGVLLFCISPHNQARLLAPLMPPAAMLAGRELDRLAARFSARMAAAALGSTVVVMLGFLVWRFHANALRSRAVRETQAILALARDVETAGGADFPLTYVAGAPFALQLALNTMRPPVSVEEAAALLRGDGAAFVVTPHVGRLEHLLGTEAGALHVLARAGGGREPFLYIVGNRPALAANDRTALRVGQLEVTLAGVHLGPTWDNVIDLSRGQGPGQAVITNVSPDVQQVRVRIDGARGEARRLVPGEAWSLRVP
jgi:4-amino-4-deoxy-L-arabinose transferase-like glycosyltransferase